MPQLKTTEEKRKALMNAFNWSEKEVAALSERMVDHYYDIMYYGD